MNEQPPKDLLRDRIGRLPSDERGSVMLVSGMMAFVVTVLVLFVMDTNEAVYDRIVAQNAVDGAAETAALWQARGMNLLQHLNTFHYWADWGLFAAESLCIADCVTAVPAAADAMAACCTVGLIFGCDCDGAYDTYNTACEICSKASTVNNIQYDMNQTVTNLQQTVSNLFPILAFGYANQMAEASGASNLVAVLPNYAATLTDKGASWLSSLGLPIPSGSGLGGLMSGVFGGMMNSGPGIYAFPLQPSSVLLHVSETPGGSLPAHPWNWPSPLPTVYDVAYHFGEVICFLSDADFEDPTHGWGWSDIYFTGHPGFMTWIAGVSGRNDVAFLEKLQWMNPAMSTGSTNTMYTGDYFGVTNANWIPPVIALASSQVEQGTGDSDGLSEHGDADSVPKLIMVYFSASQPGTNFPVVPIYH